MGQKINLEETAQRGVLAHICRILDCFSAEDRELGVREIARLADLPSSTAGRLLRSMLQQGILQQNAITREYSLGIRLLNWSGAYLASLDIRTIALPVMKELLALTLETISLYLLDGNERVCVERLESTQQVQIIARLGMRLPLHAGSAGKVILACMGDEEFNKYLTGASFKAFTGRTITDADILEKDLTGIRERGYAVSSGEWITDAAGVAAAIFGRDGKVTGALTISGPTQRFNSEKVKLFGIQVMKAAAEISRQMGYIHQANQ